MTKELNPEKLEFFEPEYKGNGSIVNIGKNVFYQDIYTFLDRLKDIEQIEGEEKLQTVITQCL